TAVGQTTHLAAPLGEKGAPGTLLLAPPPLHPAQGYVQGTSPGPGAGKGLPRPPGSYALPRAPGPRQRPPPAPGPGATRPPGRGPGADALRRPRRRDRADPPGARPRPRRSRSARGHRGGARRRQIPPRVRVHPLPSHAGLARLGGRLSVLRQGDELPARHRSP